MRYRKQIGPGEDSEYENDGIILSGTLFAMIILAFSVVGIAAASVAAVHCNRRVSLIILSLAANLKSAFSLSLSLNLNLNL